MQCLECDHPINRHAEGAECDTVGCGCKETPDDVAYALVRTYRRKFMDTLTRSIRGTRGVGLGGALLYRENVVHIIGRVHNDIMLSEEHDEKQSRGPHGKKHNTFAHIAAGGFGVIAGNCEGCGTK